MSDAVSHKTHEEYVLPASLVTKVDVARLLSEVEQVNNEFIEAEAREKVGANSPAQPVLSGQLAEFLEKNDITIGDSRAREALVRELHQMKDTVPVIHVTFSVTADGESLQKIVTWFRQSVHPQAVIDVGLQPSLVAGVYLRTANRVHDFSVRAALRQHRDILTKELEALRVGR